MPYVSMGIGPFQIGTRIGGRRRRYHRPRRPRSRWQSVLYWITGLVFLELCFWAYCWMAWLIALGVVAAARRDTGKLMTRRPWPYLNRAPVRRLR